ncbi:hypothetical protein Chor_005307 [Crotalus horridus]
MYDFPLLQQTIASELPDRKKNILTLSMHIFSENELMKKKELMKSYIKKVAWASCVCGAVPVPRLSMACDTGILVDALKFFCKVFGLDKQFLRFLAAQTGKEFKQLKSAIKKTPLGSTINEKLVFSRLMRSSLCVAELFEELGLDFIPVPWSGGASSYAVTHYFLNSFLNDAVEDAQNVQAKLLEEINISEKAELNIYFYGATFQCIKCQANATTCTASLQACNAGENSCVKRLSEDIKVPALNTTINKKYCPVCSLETGTCSDDVTLECTGSATHCFASSILKDGAKRPVKGCTTEAVCNILKTYKGPLVGNSMLQDVTCKEATSDSSCSSLEVFLLALLPMKLLFFSAY